MTAVLWDHPRAYLHITVMAQEVVAALAPRPSGVYIDVTAGGGGHSAALLDECPQATVIAFDRDRAAVLAARERLADYGDRARVVHGSFQEVEPWLRDANIDGVDGLVADLGISSQQLSDRDRGMSFRLEGPLDMRMDRTEGETARELLERVSQDELADIIYHFGEERAARRVARCIKQSLEAGELNTTLELRRAVVRAVGPRRVGGIDPATRTFQALRIAVNGELDQLATLLESAPRWIKPGGVAAFISFHSLEDRLVKRALLQRDLWQRLSNKPLMATEQEQAQNPRSRSAKLRAARRVTDEVERDSDPNGVLQ
jgi:16S rRNA (cytosine1402-N4)-methyltransferase